VSTLVLPAVSTYSSYDFQVQLEGAWYRVGLYWNSRDGYWFLSLRDGVETLLVAGRKVVLGASLFGRSVDPRLPPGWLFGVDTSGQGIDAGRADLGGRVILAYMESTGP
jgi:hypothetical protein